MSPETFVAIQVISLLLFLVGFALLTCEFVLLRRVKDPSIALRIAGVLLVCVTFTVILTTDGPRQDAQTRTKASRIQRLTDRYAARLAAADGPASAHRFRVLAQGENNAERITGIFQAVIADRAGR